MEDDIFLRPAVEQLLRQFDLFEIFTDDSQSPVEDRYRELQKKLTGYFANPSYIVLGSQNDLEVARGAFTNSEQDFIEFLERGLLDLPAFQSYITFGGLEIREGDRLVTVLEPIGALESDEGVAETYLGADVRAYRGIFSARQRFRVPDDLEAGSYPLRVRLSTGLYRGDERIETISLAIKLTFEVIDDRLDSG